MTRAPENLISPAHLTIEIWEQRLSLGIMLSTLTCHCHERQAQMLLDLARVESNRDGYLGFESGHSAQLSMERDQTAANFQEARLSSRGSLPLLVEP